MCWRPRKRSTEVASWAFLADGSNSLLGVPDAPFVYTDLGSDTTKACGLALLAELGRLLVLQRSWTRVAYGDFLFRGMALNCLTMTTGRAIARPTGATVDLPNR